MNTLKAAVASVSVAGALAVSVPAMARDTISIVGSSTVYPFATVVAERFGRSTDFPTPTLESTGSGGGLQLFCQGVGVQYPDITNASRRMKPSEFEMCQSNGVEGIVEVRIGSDGIVLASSQEAEDLNLTLEQLFLALGAQVPEPDGGDELVQNPYQKWSDIDSSLPDINIRVLGPPPTSGTRDAFNELALLAGCEEIEMMASMEEEEMERACMSVREDGVFVEAGENDNLIVQKLNSDSGSYGVFGYSFLEENSGTLKASVINGTEPTVSNISDETYPIARTMFFYVKKAHAGVIPGMAEYVGEFTSEAAWGDNGYLVDVGLIPLERDARMEAASSAGNMTPMTGDELK